MHIYVLLGLYCCVVIFSKCVCMSSCVSTCVFGLQSAEKYYVQGGDPRKAIDMYIAANRWSEAYKVS